MPAWLRQFADLPALLKFIVGYYLATPVFFLLELFFDVGIRISFITDPVWKTAYYLLLFGCMLICYLRPAWSALVGIAEGSVNILLHILSFITPLFYLPGQVTSGQLEPHTFATEQILNFLLVGLVLVFSFQTLVRSIHQHG